MKRFAFFLAFFLILFNLNAQQYLIWATNGPTQAGTGTFTGAGSYDSPYKGDLDIILSNASANANVTVRLFPGTYWVKGNNTYYLAQGMHLWGAGKDITVIKQDHTFSPNQGSHMQSYATGIDIEDMTLDCNATGSEANSKNAISLFGGHSVVRRVKVINCSGNWGNGQECFPIFVQDLSTNNMLSFNRISECEVSSSKGNYTSAITLLSAGVIDKCFVSLPVLTNYLTIANQFFDCYQATASANCAIVNNQSVGGNIGFYTDSYWETNLIIADNVFSDCWMGIRVAKASSGIIGLNISDNIIELNSYAEPSSYCCGISLLGSTSLVNLIINGNFVHFKNDNAIYFNSSWSPLVIAGGTLTNFKIIDNTFYPNNSVAGNNITTGQPNGCVWMNNTDTTGKGIPFPKR